MERASIRLLVTVGFPGCLRRTDGRFLISGIPSEVDLQENPAQARRRLCRDTYIAAGGNGTACYRRLTAIYFWGDASIQIYINQIHTIINEHRLRGGMTEGAADFLSHGGEEINGSST